MSDRQVNDRQVLVLGQHSMARWAQEYARGERSSQSPYGVHELATMGYRLVEPGFASHPGERRVWDVLEHRSGRRVERPVRAIPAARGSQAVLALLEAYAVGPAWARAARLWPYRGMDLAVFTVWLGHELRTGDADFRREWQRRLRHIDLVIALSENQREIFDEVGVRGDQLCIVPLGVDTDFYSPPPPGSVRDIPILSIGKDRGRDYATLFSAAQGVDAPVEVVCTPENVRGLSVPDNVVVHDPVPHATYRDLLRRAQVVVVPTIEMAYPTGQSVALEAAACGAAIVVSGTAPMREYFDDEVSALMPTPGDPADLAERLRTVIADDQLRTRLAQRGHEVVTQRFTTTAMWQTIGERLALMPRLSRAAH